MGMRIRWVYVLVWGAIAVLSMQAQQARPLPPKTMHEALVDEALRESSLVRSRKPFHLALVIHPGKVLFSGHEASGDMHGRMEVFWVDPTRYKLVLTSPTFRQTKIVEGDKVEETDEGDFLPRWLDDFVQAFFDPLPQADAIKKMNLRLYGGGIAQLPGRAPVAAPRCLENSDRPGGIVEETSEARICFDAAKPWIASGLSFTRYVSFSDYRSFQGQHIPYFWSDDIPENIFVEGYIETLEALSKEAAKSIQVAHPTPAGEQLKTVFLSRQKIGELLEPLPDFTWPAEDTENLEGYMIVYVRTDRTGKIRESYWDSSDNYKLQDAGVQLALWSRLKPVVIDGVPVQVEGPLVLHFKTHRSDERPLQ